MRLDLSDLKSTPIAEAAIDNNAFSHEIRTALHHIKWTFHHMQELKLQQELSCLSEKSSSQNLSNLLTQLGIMIKFTFGQLLDNLGQNHAILTSCIENGKYELFLKANRSCLPSEKFDQYLTDFNTHLLELKAVNTRFLRSIKNLLKLSPAEIFSAANRVASQITDLMKKMNIDVSNLLMTVGCSADNSPHQSLGDIDFASTKLKILIAEDDKINQKILMKALEFVLGINIKNCEIDIAENGAEAVSLWQKKKYNLIYMDIQMPVMGGNEATQKIRQEEKSSPASGKELTKSIIVAVTANHATAEQAEQWGMDAFIAKPFSREQIRGSLMYFFLKEPSSPSTPPRSISSSLRLTPGSSIESLSPPPSPPFSSVSSLRRPSSPTSDSSVLSAGLFANSFSHSKLDKPLYPPVNKQNNLLPYSSCIMTQLAQ